MDIRTLRSQQDLFIGEFPCLPHLLHPENKITIYCRLKKNNRKLGNGSVRRSHPDWREVMVLVEPLKISKIVSWPVPLFFNISLILQNSQKVTWRNMLSIGISLTLHSLRPVPSFPGNRAPRWPARAPIRRCLFEPMCCKLCIALVRFAVQLYICYLGNLRLRV